MIIRQLNWKMEAKVKKQLYNSTFKSRLKDPMNNRDSYYIHLRQCSSDELHSKEAFQILKVRITASLLKEGKLFDGKKLKARLCTERKRRK
jgi:hypothetical protein